MIYRAMQKKIAHFVLLSTVLAVLFSFIPTGGTVHAQEPEPQCRVLVIGISEYPIRDYNIMVIDKNGENVTDIDLKYSNDDAQEIYDSYCSVWGTDNGTLLLNKNATKTDIYYAIRQLNESTSAEDTVLIYFSGHGIAPNAEGSLPGRLYAQRSGAGYLSPYGTRISHLNYEISAIELATWLKDLKSNHVVIILDTCYAGSFNRELSQKGRIILMSSGADEPSLECSEIGHGIFTNFVLQAAANFDDADRNQDCILSAEEIYSYAEPLTVDGICTCNEEPLEDNIKQHPVLSDGYPGELGLFMKATIDLISPSPSHPVVYNIDGNAYTSSTPSSFLWIPGSSHSVEVPATVESGTGERFVFVSWNDGDTSASRTITNGGDYTATYKKQYKVNLVSPYGSPSGDGWYDDGAMAILSIASSDRLLMRKVFNGWNGDVADYNVITSVKVDSIKNIEARWRTDYSLLYLVTICILLLSCTVVALFFYKKKKRHQPEKPANA
jgi:hypothetical protein